MEKVAVVWTYVTVCGAVKEKMLFNMEDRSFGLDMPRYGFSVLAT